MFLKRKINNLLQKWVLAKESESLSKPIMLEGARQVGKTTTILNFFKSNKHDCIYLDLSKQQEVCEIIKTFNLDVLFNYLKDNYNFIYGKTFLFFDESQHCLEIVQAMKYFRELHPKVKLIVTGSLLSLKLSDNSYQNKIMFPTGKIITIELNPLTFEEFVINVNESLNNNVIKYLQEYKIQEFNLLYKDKLLDLYYDYLIVGGMPEAVVEYFENKKIISNITNNHNKLLKDNYKNDIKEHFKNEAEKIKALSVFDSIHKQINKENKRFLIRELDIDNKNNNNNRLRDFKVVFWKLILSRMVNTIYYLEDIKVPSIDYVDNSKFKIYYLDIAFYTSIYNFDKNRIVYSNEQWNYIKGGVTENFVYNEIKYNDKNLSVNSFNIYTYNKNNKNENMEIDFIVETNDINPMVIEVKSSTNVKAKSFNKLIDTKPHWNYIMCSLNELNIDKDKYLNIPIYLIGYFINHIVNCENYEIINKYKLNNLFKTH